MVDTASIREEFKEYLIGQNIQSQPRGLYDPVNYIMNTGGKHIRATFLLLAYSLYQKKRSSIAFNCAYAIELFHNFSLVHDDIMDDADTRRGQPSVHTKYSVSSGILSGDVMLILVYETLLKIPDELKRAKILSLFTQTAKEVCEGQQYDIDFETKQGVTKEDYLLMIKLKTAVLLACSLKIGAILGGASDTDADCLYDFGVNIGIAFQIQDDMLDTYGIQSQVGKLIGGDIQQGKKTILYLTAIDEMKNGKSEFKSLYDSNLKIEEKLPKVTELMDACQVKEKVNLRKDAYLEKALLALNNIDSNNIQVINELSNLAKFMVERSH